MNEYRRRQAWNAGNKAGKAGKSRESNNRQPCTIFYDDWADGWDEGDREREREARKAKAGDKEAAGEREG